MFNKKKICITALALISLPIAPVGAAVDTAPQTYDAGSIPNLNASQQDFINSTKPYVLQMSDKYGLWASIMMAQAIIESNWGKSQLGSAPNYNLFGMKANDSWPGKSVTYPTKEWDKNSGQYITIDAKFRAYNNYGESFEDNAQKLRYGLSWDALYYKGTWLENTSSYQDSANWLQGRYATSPTYANTLISAIQRYNLQQLDPQVENLLATGTINYVPGYGVKTYDSFAGIRQETGQYLPHGAAVNVSKKITLHDGSTFYQVGTKQWVLSQYVQLANSEEAVSEQGVVRVNYVPNYSIAVWDRATTDRNFTGQKLLHGTDWQYFSKYYVNGVTWYNVGNNQWIDGTYVTKL
ncbi:glycoside hydrolase family 73 protein [Xylocopilactobacillus apicola]|uniref:N-acetylmuramidase n=1 Tax=Xylocopilactobacillus apicola TaxID=2932184 RepID=A0AAU9D6F0_9LACO|nr:glucosaminidase domain-containing protein [Xylocopilactobacillus apicola]BDR57875.1 N-acetylmuramidase [Xylocopilactobacillus apicola]